MLTFKLYFDELVSLYDGDYFVCSCLIAELGPGVEAVMGGRFRNACPRLKPAIALALSIARDECLDRDLIRA
jgi:hypothetical protein